MRHTYRCPLRWGDMDLLGHVNNVTWVDYLQEARIDMMRVHAPDRRADDLAEGVVVVRHRVDYVAPMAYRDTPVTIDCWVSEIRAAAFTLSYEVYDDTPDGRTVYLRASTLLTPYVFAEERPRRLNAGEREVLAGFHESPAPEWHDAGTRPEHGLSHLALPVRFSDVDVFGHVNNVEYFEYLQEARIRMITDLRSRMEVDPPRLGMLVARIDVDYRAPMLFRPEPYDLLTWVGHLGRSSWTVETDIADGDRVLARARVVMVVFDPDTQQSAPLPDVYRALLTPALPR